MPDSLFRGVTDDEGLILNGFIPVVERNDSKPVHNGWNTGTITAKVCAELRQTFPDATATGILSGNPDIHDIDLHSEEHTLAVIGVIEAIAGNTPLKRFRNKGRGLIYRNTKPRLSATIYGFEPGDIAPRKLVEFKGLTRTGNHDKLTIAGTNDKGDAIKFLECDETGTPRTPFNTTLSSLPDTADKGEEIAIAVCAKLRELGYAEVKIGSTPRETPDRSDVPQDDPVPLGYIAMMLDALDPDQLIRDERRDLMFGIAHAYCPDDLDGSKRRDLIVEWRQRGGDSFNNPHKDGTDEDVKNHIEYAYSQAESAVATPGHPLIGFGTTMQIAHAHGWIYPAPGHEPPNWQPPGTEEPIRDRSFAEAFAGFAERYGGEYAEHADTASHDEEPFLLSLDDMLNQPDPTELVAGLLMEHQNVCIVGPPKAGKSFIALDICLSIAANVPAFGFLNIKRRGAVVYLSGEGHAGFKRRIKAWLQNHNIKADGVPFFYRKAVPLTGTNDDQCAQYATGIKKALHEIEAIMKRAGGGPILVVIDTMARSLGGIDENSSAAANLYLQMTERLMEQLDCPVLTIAHSGKVSDRTGDLDIRGSSAFKAGFDAVWGVSMNKQNRVIKLEALWLKDGDESELGPYGFRLEHALVDGHRGAVLRSIDQKELRQMGKPDEDNQHRQQLQWFLHQYGAFSLETAMDKTRLAERIAWDLVKTAEDMNAKARATGWGPLADDPHRDTELRRQINQEKNTWEAILEKGTRKRRNGRPALFAGLFDVAAKTTTDQNRKWFYIQNVENGFPTWAR